MPTDKLRTSDMDAWNQLLSDPRFKQESTEDWQEEIKLQWKQNKKWEQQALAKYGLENPDTYHKSFYRWKSYDRMDSK